MTVYDGFKRITGTKIHIAVNQNSLPVSSVISSANEHDSTKFVDVMENIDEHLDDSVTHQIKKVYADKGYDAKRIQKYLRNRNIKGCIPYRINSRIIPQNNNQTNYNKSRYVVERFFAWLKCGFRRLIIRYERIAENYLALVNIASIMMYWRVSG
jgi:transposase